MKKPAVLQILSNRPIAYHKEFRIISGRTVAGIFLSQLFYWADKGSDPDGWIWKTLEDWEEETGLSYSEQRTARKHLVQRKLIEEDLRGLPAQLYYRILWDNVLAAIMALYEDAPESGPDEDESAGMELNPPTIPITQTSTGEAPKQDLENLKNKSNRTPKTLITENTSREYKKNLPTFEGQKELPSQPKTESLDQAEPATGPEPLLVKDKARTASEKKPATARKPTTWDDLVTTESPAARVARGEIGHHPTARGSPLDDDSTDLEAMIDFFAKVTQKDLSIKGARGRIGKGLSPVQAAGYTLGALRDWWAWYSSDEWRMQNNPSPSAFSVQDKIMLAVRLASEKEMSYDTERFG